jgi:hypothetical protein
MGCPALGVSVAFLKQPAVHCLVKNPKQIFFFKLKKIKIISKTSQMNHGARPGSAVHQAVSKKRPKPPMLDIPFRAFTTFAVDIYVVNDTSYVVNDTTYVVNDTTYVVNDTTYVVNDTNYVVNDTTYVVNDTFRALMTMFTALLTHL